MPTHFQQFDADLKTKGWTHNATKAITIAVVLLGPLACYFGAYLASVRTEPPFYINGHRVPHYAVAGYAVERFFYPANLVDRSIRKRHWTLITHDTDLSP